MTEEIGIVWFGPGRRSRKMNDEGVLYKDRGLENGRSKEVH